MRICIDLDGVVADFKKEGETYADVAIIPGAKEKIEALRKNGHYVILYTSRHMKTCNGNVGLVMEKVGHITLSWLKKHNVSYDEIHFGKPWADIYIDDNALRFENWDQVNGDGLNLPLSNEKKIKEGRK